MTGKKQPRAWHIRVGEGLDDLVQKAVVMDLHIRKSDLIKDAVIRYLEEKFPTLIEEIRTAKKTNSRAG